MQKVNDQSYWNDFHREMLCLHKVQESQAACNIAEKGVYCKGCQQALHMLLWMCGFCKDAMQRAVRPNPEQDVPELFRELVAPGLCERLGRNKARSPSLREAKAVTVLVGAMARQGLHEARCCQVARARMLGGNGELCNAGWPRPIRRCCLSPEGPAGVTKRNLAGENRGGLWGAWQARRVLNQKAGPRMAVAGAERKICHRHCRST